ncbi:MAG TPA: sulfatase-like hydrolase/transferase, partial [Polyangia bacterium]
MNRNAVRGALLGALAISLDVTVSNVLPGQYPNLHRSLSLCTLLAWCAAASCLVWAMRERAALLTVTAGLTIVCVSGLGFGQNAGWKMLAQQPSSLSWRLLELLRLSLDADGDGRSDVLGGRDCDDTDATVHPLSLQGRDCFGWMPGPVTTEPSSLTTLPRALPGRLTPSAPKTVVLATIDAFRCGFGAGPEPFRDACPNLTRLASEGRARFDGRNNPSTGLSIGPLFLGRNSRDLNVGDHLKAHGYDRHLIVTQPKALVNAELRAGFDTRDDSLMAEALRGNGATAHRLTDLALDWVAATRKKSRPGFLWAHYYDPHAPYTPEPGATFVWDGLAAYIQELRRTDAAVGRLATALKAMENADEILLIVTADHGEEFGEAGHVHHGTSLRDEAIRVPFVVWSPSSKQLSRLPAGLPATSADFPAYLDSVLTGSPFEAATAIPLYADFHSDP